MILLAQGQVLNRSKAYEERSNGCLAKEPPLERQWLKARNVMAGAGAKRRPGIEPDQVSLALYGVDNRQVNTRASEFDLTPQLPGRLAGTRR